MELVYKHEKSLFRIAVVIATLFWVVLVVGTLGIALFYLLLAYLFFLFAHSAFISHLKGTGVKISKDQYPDLYARLVRCCDKVGVKDIPDTYLLRTDYFNALATRFLGRNFVVLFTDVVDALEERPGAVDFYIGHELGHIHRKHLLWSVYLFPATILPVLGSALRRAEEYTCDRYGVACCKSEDDIKAAIAAIAAGDTRWKTINVGSYLDQIGSTREFWMSFNELIGDYPWLTKRMATSIALSRGEEIKHPRRHMLAWLLSLFVPRVGAGGMASLVVTIAIIGILAAVAIPSYTSYMQTANVTAAYSSAQTVQDRVTDYVIENQEWPESMQDLGYETATITDENNNYEVAIYSDGIIGARIGQSDSTEGQYIVIEPEVVEGELVWSCYGKNMMDTYLPPECT